MKLKSPAILFMLFGVGLGVVAPDFATAQPFRPPVPGRGRFTVPRPPAVVRRGPVVVRRLAAQASAPSRDRAPPAG